METNATKAWDDEEFDRKEKTKTMSGNGGNTDEVGRFVLRLGVAVVSWEVWDPCIKWHALRR